MTGQQREGDRQGIAQHGSIRVALSIPMMYTNQTDKGTSADWNAQTATWKDEAGTSVGDVGWTPKIVLALHKVSKLRVPQQAENITVRIDVPYSAQRLSTRDRILQPEGRSLQAHEDSPLLVTGERYREAELGSVFVLEQARCEQWLRLDVVNARCASFLSLAVLAACAHHAGCCKPAVSHEDLCDANA